MLMTMLDCNLEESLLDFDCDAPLLGLPQLLPHPLKHPGRALGTRPGTGLFPLEGPEPASGVGGSLPGLLHPTAKVREMSPKCSTVFVEIAQRLERC